MKGKKQVIGIIPKEKAFQAEKPRYGVFFKTGYQMTEKDRPRRKYKARDIDRDF